MKYFSITVVLLVATLTASAQVASHASSSAGKQTGVVLQVAGKPVARVNGVTLTDQDLLREMFIIFPYARQHNGFPKAQEADIRRGALDMIIFEELVYQEAERRKITVPAAKLDRAVAALRRRFHSPAEYQQFLQIEVKGSRQLMRQKVKRSLLIEALLNSEVEDKAVVSPSMAKAAYDKNPKAFAHGESFGIQTISILPPEKPTADQLKELRKRADEALRQAKATKNYEQFGMLAEKLSDDDFHVNMGMHKPMGREELPMGVAKALSAMLPGQVSDLLQVEQAYTIIRYDSHNPAGKQKFSEVKDSLLENMQKKLHSQLRADFGKRLRKDAAVELL